MYNEIDIKTRYADSFGIPRHISLPFIKVFDLWVRESGEEWTVSRTKAIKLDFIRLKAGLPMVSQWVRKNRFGTFGGPVGGLLSFCKKRRKNFSRVIQLLDIYTTLYSPGITSIQETKFLDGVNAPPVDLPDNLRFGIVDACLNAGIRRTWISDPRPIVSFIPSPSTRQPMPDGSVVPDIIGYLPSLDYLENTKLGLSLKSRFSSIFKPLLEGCRSSYTFSKQWELGPCYKDSVGKIGMIQEAGYKLRAVANPARVYQYALKPLGDCLYDIIRDLPWDCTHNQALPFREIQSHISLGLQVHSVDLSGATDYFPLNLQMEVARFVSIRSDYPDLFEKISRSPWIYRGSTIKWSKGQPLGLQPSFALFTLTHGLLLYYLNNFKHGNMFYVVGDDVVILDDELYDKYRQCLQTLCCPVSESKTLSSTVLAEFAGKIITRDAVIPQLKWRQPSDDNFIDLVRNIGPRSIGILKPRQRKIVKVLWDIPDFLGGLGFNPKGLSLSERYFKYLNLFDNHKNISYLMSYNRMIAKGNYYPDTTNLSLRFSYEPKSDFDQKSYSYVLSLLPSLINWYEVVGSNLYSISSDLSLPLDSNPMRLTRLQQLEKAIAI